MISNIFIKTALLFTALIYGHAIAAQSTITDPDNELIKNVKSTKGFVALWKFDEEEGKDRKAIAEDSYLLKESNGKISRINEGPVSGYSIRLDGTNYLSLPHAKTGKLNISGEKGEVTVIAWINWSGEQTGFVEGMWNEQSTIKPA